MAHGRDRDRVDQLRCGRLVSPISSQDYSNEMLVVQGGDQQIAAVITEMYTTALTTELKDWLESINDYPKPFSFVLRLVSDLLNIQFQSLFPEGEADFGCLERDLPKENETGRRYYVQKTTETVMGCNGTKDECESTTVSEIRYCDFDDIKDLEDKMAKKRMALERAVTAYLEEHPRYYRWHQLDLEIIRSSALNSGVVTRSYHMYSADCDTGHALVSSKVRLQQRSRPKGLPRIDTAWMSDPFKELDEVPSMDELNKAIDSLPNNKSPDSDSIPPEAITRGNPALLQPLYELLCLCWEEGSGPQDMRNTTIVTQEHENKGDRSDCNNYRGIFLLIIVGKVYARILLNRLQIIADSVYPKSGPVKRQLTSLRQLKSGVKHRCVFEPTLFGIFFSLLLSHAFDSSTDGVYLHSRPVRKLFTLARLRSRTKVMSLLLREMLFADDLALASHTRRALQR
ncbi:hypothetical protein Bbelb_362050 [Branchiostoma belcheri]|nr:hypothetical protein Bbelb_362050 [Branchiostoma belcheri]